MPQPTGMQQSFGTPQPFGIPQPTGMQQPAPAPAMQSLEMPELLAEPPKDESSSFVIPQFETPQFDLPQSDTPQFDAQQRQFDLQQEQFAQQQRQFDMHQQQFGMPAPQPAAPAFGIPEFPQPSAQPAKETCRYCGMQYFSGIKYCPGCGAEVSDNPG